MSYDNNPYININGFDTDVWQGYNDIVEVIHNKINIVGKNVIIMDCYPGVRYDEIKSGIINRLNVDMIICSDDLTLNSEVIDNMIDYNMTDDRVFGRISLHGIDEFFDFDKIDNVKDKIDGIDNGVIVIYGVGASLVYKSNLLLYFNLSRWEIQLRYRSKELANWKSDNFDEDILRKYKRGYFFEWRIADRHKCSLYDSINYMIDTNSKNNPKMITGIAFRGALNQVVNKPFRLVPYFDEGVWGGQWMKDVCNLDKNSANYAWSFDGVPEENSIKLKFGDIIVEVPSYDLVYRNPKELLGDKVYARFGKEFPIRFDFLDTIKGQNLSLQVHPLVEYIKDNFGMSYTQSESYYILDCDEESNPAVYLGVKNGVNKDEFINALRDSQNKGEKFDSGKYINRFPVKKHDHILIPPGTIHCSGSGTMVLEVSATPYIFTFKLFDWDRLGLDGRPRPVHIEHGEKVIQFNRNTDWVKANLINNIIEISKSSGNKEESTGLYKTEFIETRRNWFSKKVYHKTNGSVNMLNLVDGKEAIVESVDNSFEPFVVHYAETFIIPEKVKEYTIRPYGESENKEIATIKAYVRI